MLLLYFSSYSKKIKYLFVFLFSIIAGFSDKLFLVLLIAPLFLTLLVFIKKDNLRDAFFDSFREDYVEFDKWFNKKADDICYVCYSEGKLTAFLFIKREDENENYYEINPVFAKKKRLKIGF